MADLDPLAVLLAGVWTKTVDSEQVKDKALEVLERAKEHLNHSQRDRHIQRMTTAKHGVLSDNGLMAMPAGISPLSPPSYLEFMTT